MSIFRLEKDKADDRRVDVAILEAKQATAEARSAVARFLSVIGNIPLDEAIISTGTSLTEKDDKT